MAINLAYVAQNHEHALDLAHRLTQRGYTVVPLNHVPFPIPSTAAINASDAFIFIWSPNSVGDGDMQEIARIASIAAPAKDISVRTRLTNRSTLPTVAFSNGPLFLDDIDAIVAALGNRGRGAPLRPSSWNPFVVFGVLIGVLLLFFAYISAP